MPYDGLFSFLLVVGICNDPDDNGCQCPMTGFFHFYWIMKNTKTTAFTVSMPYDGLFSFLHICRRRNQTWGSCGVNALWRAFFISTFTASRMQSLTGVCQCPMTGFFHFYTFDLVASKPTFYYGVNALWRAFFISTSSGLLQTLVIWGVNALWRAFFISTPLFATKIAFYARDGVNALWRAFFISTKRK